MSTAANVPQGAAPVPQLMVKPPEPASDVQQQQTFFVIHTMPVISNASNTVCTTPPEVKFTEAPVTTPTTVYGEFLGLPPAKRQRAKYRKRQLPSFEFSRVRKTSSKPFSALGDRQKQRVKKEFDDVISAFCERHKIEDKSEICDRYCPLKLQKKLTGDETYQLQTKLKFSGKTMNKLRSILNSYGCNVFASKRAVKIIEEKMLQDNAELRDVAEVDVDEHVEVDEDTSGELVDVEDEEIEVDESPDIRYEEEEQYVEEALEGEDGIQEYEVNISEEYIDTPIEYVDVEPQH